MSSLTNVVLSLYVARTLGATQFGAFSLAYVTYGFALNASRGLAVEPLLIRFSGASLPAWRRAVAGCTGTAIIVGLVTGACALAAGPLVGGTTGLAFRALGLTLPVLLLQDSWRYAFFALGRAHHAFINDAIWAAIQIPALVLLKISGHANVFWFVLVWGLSAGVAAVAGLLQARVIPSLTQAAAWLARHRDLGPRYLAENTGPNAVDTLRSYGVSSILGLAAVGYIQAVNVLMGPLKIILFGTGLITLPEAARLLRRSPRRLPVFCVTISAALTLLALLWGAALLVGLPHGLGYLTLGSIWRPAYPLVVPMTFTVMAVCAGVGPYLGLHALGAARRSLRIAIFTSLLVVTCALAGAVIAGTLGTMYCGAAATWVGALLSWWQLRQALHEADRVGVPNWLWPRSAGRHRSFGVPRLKLSGQSVARPP